MSTPKISHDVARACIALRCVRGWTYSRIAQAIGCRTGTVEKICCERLIPDEGLSSLTALCTWFDCWQASIGRPTPAEDRRALPAPLPRHKRPRHKATQQPAAPPTAETSASRAASGRPAKYPSQHVKIALRDFAAAQDRLQSLAQTMGKIAADLTAAAR